MGPLKGALRDPAAEICHGWLILCTPGTVPEEWKAYGSCDKAGADNRYCIGGAGLTIS